MPPKQKKSRKRKRGSGDGDGDDRSGEDSLRAESVEREEREGTEERTLDSEERVVESEERTVEREEECDEEDGVNKRARLGPVFTDEDEATIIEFVKNHPELYTKENARYLDKTRKDSLWKELADQIGRTAPEVQRWFNSQRTRYGKITSKHRKSGQGAPQMTGRQKWVLQNFGFLSPHILRKASTQTAGFNTSTSSRHDESRGSGTGTDAEMDSSSQVLSQSILTPVTTSTPAQPSTPATESRQFDMYQQTYSLITGFIQAQKDEKKKSEHQPFYDFVASEADKIPAADFPNFQRDLFTMLQSYLRGQGSQSTQPTQPTQPTQHQRLPLPIRSATVTTDSQREGVLPPVTRAFLGSNVTTSTAAVASSSSTGTIYYTPSPISFGNPPSVSLQLSDDISSHNISGYLNLPDFTVTPTQQQPPQQLTLQTTPTTAPQQHQHPPPQ